ncbi:MAG: trypsin-like peptidase domain-containing protein [Treponema sp.]|nr:trypsin-like peptidase domain-containing protein [Treponema sp.]
MKIFDNKFRRIILFLVLSCFSITYAQNLREYVCIVQGNLSDKNKTYLESIRDSLERYGYSYYSKCINNYFGGTFGSGFIWYGPDAKPYIVTNKHVVRNYETVTVSFENADGSVSDYKNLPIVFIDEDVDVALIGISEGFKREGLLFVKKTPDDGTDVFSAGFPGLAGRPSWQFGKGVVTNSSAKIKELLNPDISHLIQHSAQIDAGNSGGPLLVKDASAKAGYRVCGVNTWSAISRQNTNFSIPSSAVEKIIKNNYGSQNTIPFEKRCEDFGTLLSGEGDFTEIVPYISDEMIIKYGDKAIKDVLGKASTSARTYVSNVFEVNPIEGLRYAIAYFVYGKGHSENPLSFSEALDESAGKKIKFSAEEKAIEAMWIQERGQWRLSEFEGITASKPESEKSAKEQNTRDEPVFSLHDPYMMSLGLGFLDNFNFDGKNFEIRCGLVYDYFSLGLSCFGTKVSYTKKGSYYEPLTTETAIPVCFGMYAQGRLPLKISSFIIIPFAEIQGGLGYSSVLLSEQVIPFYYAIGGGLEFSFYTKGAVSPFVSIRYNEIAFLSSGVETSNIFTIDAGIKLIRK